ncbi:MAG: hypothetical protein HZA54_19980, partial [Planctomycetes bacterium]|nr:hypothetical protein [Planctomycetota bacterium]
MRLPFPPRIPLKILLAGLAGLALLHVAIVEGLQGGACVACRWCMDCGAAYRETRCDLFGLVPLTRSTRIEPGPIAAFL